ncbi:hypothetical protein D3C80_2024730 [compost metagenome]
MIAAGGAVIDHEELAALGFDNVAEGGEGCFAQGLDDQFAHAGLLFFKFENAVWILNFVGGALAAMLLKARG